ncbi:MAG: TIR domain-containing protein [Cytophagaceae bacterium]
MAKDGDYKKIFISFAIEDIQYRDYLVLQTGIKHAPFRFIDMSVRRRWKEHEWQRRCRLKIRSCDGVIALLSRNTYHAGGARWEIRCAREEKIPVIGMHIHKINRGCIPPELKGKKVLSWTWENLEAFVKSL